MSIDVLLSVRDRAPLDALIDPDYPERLRQMATCLYAHLLEEPVLAGQERAVLARMALDLTDGLSAELGGGSFYMHKGHRYRLSLRDRQLVDDYKGNNISQLALRYNLTETRVRQILQVWHAEQLALRQHRLFDESEG